MVNIPSFDICNWVVDFILDVEPSILRDKSLKMKQYSLSSGEMTYFHVHSITAHHM